MKLVKVTCIEEFKKETLSIFVKAKISAFSQSDIQGYKIADESNLISNWFSSSKDMVNSNLLFSVSSMDKIEELLESIKTFNINSNNNNPLRAVVLDIEKYV